jgi:hypothetical protein
MLTGAAASESNFNPTAPHDYDRNGVPAGYGMFGHQGPRLDAMRQATGAEKPNWKQQATFALTEAQDPRYRDMLANAKTPEDLARVQMHFERPKGYTPENPEAGHNYAGRVAHIAAFQPLASGQDVNWPTAQPQAGPQPQTAGVKPWYDKMAPTDYQGKERKGGMGEFLTSKDFVIPLLTGLGTMASSPSRYLGAAILQGLGGGAQAYANLQKQQADIGQTLAGTGLTKATTEGTNVSTAAGSIVYSGGQLMFLKRNPAGGFDVQRAFEYFKLPAQERTALGLSAADVEKLKVQAAKEGYTIGEDGAVKTEGGLKPPSVSTTAPPSPGAQKAEERNLLEPPLPDPKILTAEEKGALERNLTAAQAQPELAKDFYTDQKLKGDTSRNMQPLMRNLAVSMARLPETGSPNVAGRLSPLTVGGTEVVSNLLRILGRDPSKLGIADTTDPQEIQKIIANIAGDPQYQGNIHAHAILSDIAQRFPTMINTREGQAKLMSSVMALQRREIDKDDYNNALLQHANSIDPGRGILSGRENNALFERRYGRLNEEPVLQKMFLTPMVIDGKKQIDPETKRPMSQMEFLYKNGGQLSPAERTAIENQLKAPRILRHFGL